MCRMSGGKDNPVSVQHIAMDGSDDEVNKNHYCSKDLFAEAPEGF
jgi:hypothetical protein